jgi:hypothetical protein
MSAGRTVLRDVKITTSDSTKPPSAPMIQGRIDGFGLAAVTPAIVHTQPTAAVTRRMAKRPTVFHTVSSTVMRSVSTAPADGAAYMPSRWAWAAASVPACCAAPYCACAAGGGVRPAA